MIRSGTTAPRFTTCHIGAPARVGRATLLGLTALALLVAMPLAPVRAQDADPPVAETKPDEVKPEPKAVAATKGKFSVVLNLTGVLDAKEQWDIEVDAEMWSADLEVEEGIATGPVEKDAVLVRFKTDKIDEAIVAAERDLALARNTFARQSDDAKRAEESATLALLKATFDAEGAEIAWTRWQDYEKGYRLLEQDLRLQGQRDNFADAAEELAQLEKMYKADEITEETEEIVLKRSRRDFERRKQYLSMFERRDAAWRAQDFPRDQGSAETTVRRARMEFERTKLATQAGLESGRLEFEKAKSAFTKQEENLAKLKRDRERFVVKAPVAGIAVRGVLTRGKWTGTEEPSTTLRAGAKVKAHQTLFTIVRAGDVYVRTTVGEGSVFSVRAGQGATVTPNAATKLHLAAKVSRVVPVSPSAEFDVFLALDSSDPRLMPGHSVKLKLTTLEKDAAITVPAGSVEKDGDKRFVHVSGATGVERREVDVGETTAGRTEILSGIAEGEKVLESVPKSK